MIAVIDYDTGNMKSVEKALEALGESPVITRDPGILLKADKLILPGVGAFGDAMKKAGGLWPYGGDPQGGPGREKAVFGHLPGDAADVSGQ